MQVVFAAPLIPDLSHGSFRFPPQKKKHAWKDQYLIACWHAFAYKMLVLEAHKGYLPRVVSSPQIKTPPPKLTKHISARFIVHYCLSPLPLPFHSPCSSLFIWADALSPLKAMWNNLPIPGSVSPRLLEATSPAPLGNTLMIGHCDDSRVL